MVEIRDSGQLSLSRTLQDVVEEAEEIAFEAGQVPATVHLLLAFFTSRNSAERYLRGLGVTEDRLLARLDPPLHEPRGAVRAVMQRAAQVAASCASEVVDGLHVLVGMTRVRECSAYALLERTGERIPRLRTRALTLVTGASPRWLISKTPGRNRALEDDGPQGIDGDNARRRRHHLSRRPLPRKDSAGPGAIVQWTPPLVSPPVRAERRDPRPRRPPERPAEPREMEMEARTPPLPGPLGAERAFSAPTKPFELPPSEFPWLTSLGRNLSVEAARGDLDVLTGRETEVEQLIDVLGKRRANNPCLIGEPGVGKTAIVEGLATRWANGTAAEQERVVVALEAGRLLVGTHLRGSFSEKLRGIQDEVEKSRGRVCIFFDELHTLIGAGASGEGPLDAANELKAALSRGRFPCIGATTPEEFRRYIAKDPALKRRFVPILVREPSPEQAESMLYCILPAYSDHHGVGYTPEAVHTAIRLSVRFLPEQHLPDKAIALLDHAGSRASRALRKEVGTEDIARLVSERAKVPIERLLATDQDRLLRLESELEARVVGHPKALRSIAETIRRNAAGFGSQRPQGSFLLVGPPGVGKTETAKALAEVLHGGVDALLRLDLSEFGEAHSVSRLVGAPPGYSGHDAGGQLTESVRRRPASVILFDEIEKAHRDVLQVLLQILDEGRLTDGHGRTVGFSESILVLTSNLGSEAAVAKRPIGFEEKMEDSSAVERDVMGKVRRTLAPELWARIDEKLFFGTLGRPELKRIVRMLVARSSERLRRERGITFTLDGRAIELILEQAGNEAATLGARPLRRVLGHTVEGPIAARILEGRLHSGEHVQVSRGSSGGLVFRVGDMDEGAAEIESPR